MRTSLRSRVQVDGGLQPQTPRFVEIVGPAGAGKSTLYQALGSASGSIRLSNFPDVRKAANAPFFILNGLQLLLTFPHLFQPSDRQLTRSEFAWLSILNGWPGILHRESRDGKVIILDQGPVYLLTETREFGPECLRSQETERLWQDLYSRWASTLDMIVWLDAADPELAKRIRSRHKEHIVKHASVDATSEFLVRYRNAYERTISGLSANHPRLKILRFDTRQVLPEELACRLLLEFGLI